ncbi:programmed cell death protein 4-like isoform X1 [Tachypleus tridentatus]|uniref:programmed cell death protein 4-like isoform X1 n=1 Tax=Tachypleus tridentatus TaxID=6853 RepID=UPI003FD562F5
MDARKDSVVVNGDTNEQQCFIENGMDNTNTLHSAFENGMKLKSGEQSLQSELQAISVESNLASQNNTISENRLKHKAKRPSKTLNLNNEINCNTEQFLEEQIRNKDIKCPLKLSKNSRRSRAGFGRGLPKKGGGGGKGTWGKPGSELIVEEDDIDKDVHDPNYDSDIQENCEFESILPKLTTEEFERIVDTVIKEYFENGDTSEVAMTMKEVNLAGLQPALIEKMIIMAMERKPSHREMTSVLLSDLYGHVFTEEDYEQGFDSLLDSMADLVLDTPSAPMMIGNFIARAVADDCIPSSFIESYRGNVDCQYIRSSLEHADNLLSMKHGLVRLDNVWGVGGGMRPVRYFINKIQLLLKEYLSSGDVSEATRCLIELEVPHFHHEFVYEAVLMVLEDNHDLVSPFICKLLKALATSVIVTPDQMRRGFQRVYEEMADISIDIPYAYSILEKFVTEYHAAGFLPEELIKNIPFRGRKRFVSEGDGGCIKSNGC